MKQHQNSRGFSHHFLLPVIAIVAVGAIGLVTLKLSGAATTCQGSGRILKKGTSSVCVKYAAYMMNAVSGTGEKVKDIDTMFGQQMYDKTVRYQTKKNLGIDGKIGPKTWAKLCAANYKEGSKAATAKAKACKSAAGLSSTPKGQENLEKKEEAKRQVTVLYYVKSEYPTKPTVERLTNSILKSDTAQLQKINANNEDLLAKSRADEARYNLTWKYLTTSMGEDTLKSECAKLGGTVKQKTLEPNRSYHFLPLATRARAICGL